MPSGGDPVTELGPYFLKGCLVTLGIAAAILILLGVWIAS